MRPKQLIMRGFGPYKGEEVIDFSVLGSRNLFLITGNTGAGKTSIFDAIAYALYGEASGSDRDYKSLISDFADDDTITQVIFEFSLNQKHYRIERIPAQERKKKSGEGTTTQTASAALYQINAEGEEILITARRVSEVNDQVMGLIGLDANQFKQIMMLPQNAFRELLTSKSDERQMILQRLFMTQKYQRFESLLKEKTKELKKELEGVERDLVHELSEVLINDEEKANYDIKTDLADITSSLHTLQQLIEAHKKQNKKFDKDILEGQKKLETMNDRLSKESILLDTFHKRDALKKDYDGMKEKRIAMDILETRLKNGEKALFVAKEESIYNQLKKEKNDLEKRLKDLTERKKGAEQALETAQKELEQSKTTEKVALEQLKLNLQTLGGYQENLVKYQEMEKNRLQQHKQLIQLENSLKSEKKNEKEAKQAIERIKNDQSAYDDLYKRKDTLNEQLSINRERQHRDKTLADLLDRYSKEQEKHRQLTEDYKNKRRRLKNNEEKCTLLEKRWDELKQLDTQNVAHKLADNLKNNEPCPVCGSVHHPSPAKPVHPIPESELEQAEKDFHTLKSKIDSLEGRLEAIKENGQRSKEEKESLWKKIIQYPNEIFENAASQDQFQTLFEAFSISVQKNNATQEALTAQFNALKKEEKQLEKMKKSLQKREQQLALSSKKREELEMSYTELKYDYAKVVSKTDSLKETIPSQYLDPTTLSEAIHTKKKRIKSLEKHMEQAQQTYEAKNLAMNTLVTEIKGLRQNEAGLTEKLSQQAQALESAWTKYGFESFEAYNKARMDEQMIKSEREKLEAFNSLYNEKKALLSSLNQQLMDKKKPDTAILKEEISDLSQKLDQLKGRQITLKDRIKRNTRRLNATQSLHANRIKLEEKYGTYGYLLEITKGGNDYRINFERFVQTSFLDDILSAANQKLERMTDGRYLLNRITQTENRRSTSGLDIEVFDQYTGESRHVKTLSGGEGFKASLAMALGLSQVVQSHSGGVSLETLFIDEGFGSLDSESLDNAIKTLMELQSGGRLVGIISHVAELKERIDTYLEVTSTKDGSYTEFFVP